MITSEFVLKYYEKEKFTSKAKAERNLNCLLGTIEEMLL